MSIAALLYVLGTTVVLGVVPREELVKSAAPFADAARIMWGSWAADIVGVAVMISSLGALNGWTLLMGQVPMAAAQDRLFPALFGRVSSRGVPAVGIIFSAVLATVLDPRSSGGLVGLRSLLQPRRQPRDDDRRRAVRVLRAVGRTGRGSRRRRWQTCRPWASVEWIAFVFSIFTLYGCGLKRCSTASCS